MSIENRDSSSILGDERESELLKGESLKTATERAQEAEKGKEAYNEQVVNHNVVIMNEAIKELAVGSIGGYANPYTGKIIAFGNRQDVGKEVWSYNHWFNLRVGGVGRKKGEIVTFYQDVDAETGRHFKDRAISNIEKSIEVYNAALEKDDN